MLLLLAAGSAHAQVANPEFSARAAGQDQVAEGWTAAGADRAFYRHVDDDGHSRNDCLRYQADRVRPTGAVTQIVPCKPKVQYRIEAWLKSDGMLRPAVVVADPDDPSQELTRVVGDAQGAWHRKTAGFNSGERTRVCLLVYGDVSMRATGQSAVGMAAADDVRFFEKEPEDAAPAAEAWKAPGPNCALAKPYTLSRMPSYGLCTDPGDKTQLTDGVFTVGYFWTQKTTVGWGGAGSIPLVITVDLGQVEPICGVGYNTGAGVADVHWPTGIRVLTSDDGKRWYVVGNLAEMDDTAKEPPAPDIYAIHRYATGRLQTRGRYVAFIHETDTYAFCDEVEVYRGTHALPDKPQGRLVGTPEEYHWRGPRLDNELSLIEKRIGSAKLPAGEKGRLGKELDVLRGQCAGAFAPLPAGERAILPLNRVQESIYSVHGAALKGMRLPALIAWKKHRFDPLAPIELPDPLPKAAPSLSITAMNNEFRSDALVLTNATPMPMRVKVRVAGLPGGTNPAYISVRDVPFVDSSPRVDAACPLVEAPREGADYVITIPAGMNRQVWVMANPKDVPAGAHRGTLLVNAAGAPALRVPLALRIARVRFPARPRLHVGGWDYNEGQGSYDGAGNAEAMVAYLKTRYVDAPWAGSGVLGGPSAKDFDAEGRLTRALDFSNLDAWVKRWDGARIYLSFLNAGGEFAGVKSDAPGFAPRVAAWMQALADHLKVLGLRPDQFGILVWDEPNNEQHAGIIRPWAEAIRASGAGILVWEDPQFHDPHVEPFRSVLAACDIISPIAGFYYKHDAVRRDFYRGLESEKRKLWFYNASGPVRALDPYSYHRLQEWLCFREGAEGSCFWAFCDAGGGSSWNEPASKRGSGYAPQYLEGASNTDSKHMMAIVEGVQDYEYLCLLRDRVRALEAKGVRTPALAAAKDLLSEAPARVLAGLDTAPDTEMLWKTPKDRSVADRMCERVLDALETLAREP